MTDQVQSCQRALDGALAMIESVSPATLATPTPCADWDVRALIDHMIGVVQTFEAGFARGAELTVAAGQGRPGLAGDDLAATYRQAANALMQSPPQLDVMTHADDVRFGLYVVARLSVGLGLHVELRPSAFGGTPGAGLFKAFTDFVAKPDNVDGITQQMEADAKKAFAQS